MICISVTPESRVLAKADLLNAARQCDLVELCLDRLIKPPDVAELIRDVGKPILVSCRRVRDGGRWAGAELERLAMLRSAINAGADYVELEVDVAGQVSRRGDTKRVISFTNLEQPLEDVRNVFDRAAAADADIVKFTWPTPTLDEVWPMLAAASRRREVPVVGMGLGVSSRSFSLLGRKYNCPWIYAASERGMETHDGQVTVGELDDVFGWREIGPRTQFVGIVGFGASRERATRVLNAAFRSLKLDKRCLPLDIGSMQKLPHMLELLQIDAILTTRDMGRYVMPLARKRDELAVQGDNADLLLWRSDAWTAYNVIGRAAVWVVKQSLKRQVADGRSMDQRSIVVVGHDRIASSVLHALKK
ncbi:MAG: type I 3-dehydroquinate dehydratase, partial [Planctomycetota bacterium]|nr:type I 3-dehydroquinate dehydratase [Planctomycetota bacterium]